MAYKTGKSKSLDDITLADALENPIWEWALDEEGIEEQDETWQRPIIDTINVTDEIGTPIITIKIKETDIYGSAEYEHETENLIAIAIWSDNKWEMIGNYKISAPVTFISIPKINGIENVEFVCSDILADQAERI